MHIAGMSVPPVLAAPGDRAMARLRRIDGRGLLVLLSMTVLLLVSVLAALRPDRTLPLTWSVPALALAMVAPPAVVLMLPSTAAFIRRRGRRRRVPLRSPSGSPDREQRRHGPGVGRRRGHGVPLRALPV